MTDRQTKRRKMIWVITAVTPILILAAVWILVFSPPRSILRVVAGQNPSQAGNEKATDEFVDLLNVFYNRWQGSEPPVYDHRFYLPLILKGWMDPPPTPPELIQPGDLAYVGAFRLPDGPEEIGWAWSGAALTYSPGGDPDGPEDGYPGSLFGTGHNWNQWVSEVSVPVPVNSPTKNLDDLPTAATLH